MEGIHIFLHKVPNQVDGGEKFSKPKIEKVAKFLYDHIFTRYGVPREIVTNKGTYIIVDVIFDLIREYEIRHKNSTPYHPQSNNQVVVTNKEIEAILTNTIAIHRTYLQDRLLEVAWEFNTTCKTTNGFTPFEIIIDTKFGSLSPWSLSIN